MDVSEMLAQLTHQAYSEKRDHDAALPARILERTREPEPPPEWWEQIHFIGSIHSAAHQLRIPGTGVLVTMGCYQRYLANLAAVD